MKAGDSNGITPLHIAAYEGHEEVVELLQFGQEKTMNRDSSLSSNDIGFMGDDVEAICAIGESTKKRKEGFIGQKGIGFKSVFSVTDDHILLAITITFALMQIIKPQSNFGVQSLDTSYQNCLMRQN